MNWELLTEEDKKQRIKEKKDEWRRNNPDKIKEYRKQRSIDPITSQQDRETRNRRSRERYQKEPEYRNKILEKNAQWRENQKE